MARREFGFETPWEPASWGHAHAYVGGAGEVQGSLRRGITARAEAMLTAEAEAALRFIAIGGLSLGAEAGVQLGFQAAMPLDLFGDFGIVARLDASARAAVWARAEVGLSAEALADLLRARLSGPPLELALAVLREMEVRAGYAARAAVSAEAYARLVVAGSLVPTANGDPGFHVLAEAGYGLKAGAGYLFTAAFGIHDPHRLIVSVSGVIETTVWSELEIAARRDPVVRDALPLLRVVIPAALPAAFAAGKALAEDDLARRRVAMRELNREVGRSIARALAIGPLERQRLIELGLGVSAAEVDEATLEALARRIEPRIESDVVPVLRVAARFADPVTAAFLTDTAIPAVRVFATLLRELPAIRSARDDAASLLRERLSLGLIAVLGRCVVTLSDVLQEHALSLGARTARELAGAVREGAEEGIVGKVTEAWRSVAGRLLLPDRELVADILSLSADVAERWSVGTRPQQHELLQRLIREIAAIADPAMAQLLEDRAKPAGEQALAALAQTSAEGIADLLRTMTPRVLRIFRDYGLRQGGALGQKLRDAAETGKAVLDEAIRAAGNLRALVDRFGEQIRAAWANIDRELAALGQTLAGATNDAVGDVREWGWRNVIEPALHAVPLLADVAIVRPHVRSAYDAAFDALDFAARAPFRVLQDAKREVDALLRRQIELREVNGAVLLTELRKVLTNVRGSIGIHVRIDWPILVDLGTLGIDSGQVAALLADRVEAVLKENELLSRLLNFATTVIDAMDGRNDAVGKLATATRMTADDAARLTTGRAPAVTVSPDERPGADVAIRIEVRNINASFLEPVATLPRRVELSVDGNSIDVPASAWSAEGELFRLRLVLRPSRVVVRVNGVVGQRMSRMAQRLAMPDAAPEAVAVRHAVAVHLRPDMMVQAFEPPPFSIEVPAGEHLVTVAAADGTGWNHSDACIVTVAPPP